MVEFHENSFSAFRNHVDELYEGLVVQGKWVDPKTLQLKEPPGTFSRIISNVWARIQALWNRQSPVHPLSYADVAFSTYLSKNEEHFKELIHVNGNAVHYDPQMLKIFAIAGALYRKAHDGYQSKFTSWIPGENSAVKATYLINVQLHRDDNSHPPNELGSVMDSFRRNREAKLEQLEERYGTNEGDAVKSDAPKVDPREQKFRTCEEILKEDLSKEQFFFWGTRFVGLEQLALMKKAADLGHPEALLAIGKLYSLGTIGRQSIDVDYAEAIIWLKKAVNAGVYSACGQLASIYLTGDAKVAKDEKEAERLLYLGVRHGAMLPVAIVHKNGSNTIANVQTEEHIKSLFESYRQNFSK